MSKFCCNIRRDKMAYHAADRLYRPISLYFPTDTEMQDRGTQFKPSRNIVKIIYFITRQILRMSEKHGQSVQSESFISPVVKD